MTVHNFNILTNKHPESVPKRCGDCNFCSEPIPLQVEGYGIHISFRCQHPHPMARDGKGRATGVDPDQPPPDMFCPIIAGHGVGFDIFRPKLTAHQLAKETFDAVRSAKSGEATHNVQQSAKQAPLQAPPLPIQTIFPSSK